MAKKAEPAYGFFAVVVSGDSQLATVTAWGWSREQPVAQKSTFGLYCHKHASPIVLPQVLTPHPPASHPYPHHQSELGRLRDEMHDAVGSTDDLRADLANLQSRKAVVSLDQKCAICGRPLS